MKEPLLKLINFVISTYTFHSSHGKDINQMGVIRRLVIGMIFDVAVVVVDQGNRAQFGVN